MRDVFGQPLRGNPAARRTAPPATRPRSSTVRPPARRARRLPHARRAARQRRHARRDDRARARLARGAQSSRASAGATTRSGPTLCASAATQRIPVRAARDRAMLTGVKLPAPDAARAGSADALRRARSSGRAGGATRSTDGPLALVQVTDLGVHARIGAERGRGVGHGRERRARRAPAPPSTLYDAHGKPLATATHRRARARAPHAAGRAPPRPATTTTRSATATSKATSSVTLGDDRAIAAINRYDPDLSPWRFDVSAAWGDDRLPLAGAVFTERGIYRPGERVYAKAIVRDGPLGALRVPARRRLDQVASSTTATRACCARRTVALSAFGTPTSRSTLPARRAGRPLQRRACRCKRQGELADGRRARATASPSTGRPSSSSTWRADSGDALPRRHARPRTVQARYLFGAPMGRAAVDVDRATVAAVAVGARRSPAPTDWYVGESGAWWEDDDRDGDDRSSRAAPTRSTRAASARSRVTLPRAAERPRRRA